MSDVVRVQPVERGEQLLRVHCDHVLRVEMGRSGGPLEQWPAAH